MRKSKNAFIAILLGTSVVAGITNKISCNKIKKQEIIISLLETKIKSDSSTNFKNYSKLANRLRDTAKFYSDSLDKVLTLYDKTNSENEKLNKKIRFLSGNTKKDDFFKNKYALLAKNYDSLKDEKDKEDFKNKELSDKLMKKEIFSETGYSHPSKGTEKIFNVKNQNFFRNWKTLSPKFFGISGRYLSFKDNDPEKMEAFAKYKTGRLIPLEKFDVSDNFSSFYLPEINFPEGTISVYAIDKDGNKSRECSVYISGDKVSKKKIE